MGWNPDNNLRSFSNLFWGLEGSQKMLKILTIMMTILSTLLGALGAFLIKKSKIQVSLQKILKNYTLILGVSIYAISPIFYIIALKWGELTCLYPLISVTYIWSSLLAVKFLGERMNIYKWMGISLLIAGVALVVR